MNQTLFYYLNNLAGKSVCFDTAVIFIAQYLGYWLVAGVFAFLIFNKDRRREWKMIIFSAVSVFLSRIVFTEIIRFFYHISRPFINNPTVHQLIFHETSYSFPSGHAAFFFALAMAIFFFHKRWSILFFGGAVLIAMARIIAGVHWPMDILGGAVIGILSSILTRVGNRDSI